MSLFVLCYVVSLEEGDVVYDRFETSAVLIQYTYHTVAHIATLRSPSVVICHSPFRNKLSEELFFNLFNIVGLRFSQTPVPHLSPIF